MADAYPPVQPPVGYAPPPRGGAGMAIASMVLGIVSLVLFCIWWLAIPCAILAVILGIVARGKANRGEAEGRGMATAGIICGAIAILLAVLLVAGALAFLGYVQKNPELMKQFEEMQRQAAPATRPSALLHTAVAWLG